jgi:hypothetical protein
VVEAQHVVATRKLVDSLEEQRVLEDLIESGKPPLPADEDLAGLHYLLFTPFRYPPLRHGSRFATRFERSVWYGSRELRAAFAETAYYRLLFLEGTTADIGRLEVGLTSFRATVRTRRGVDLTQEPFGAYEDRISSPSSYAESQRLGAEMRAAGVQAFRYRSARDRRGGVNVGLFSPRAFASKEPAQLRAWHCVTTRSGVEFVAGDLFDRRHFEFPRSDFEIEGHLPAPAP